MEGDDEIVTTLGEDGYGIDSTTQLPNITHRFYLEFPDEFDGIAVFTTFPDLSQGGAAYSVGPGAGVQGIGFAASGAGTYGSEGRLVSVINMNNTDHYGDMSPDDPFFATTFGQEFGHTWLSYMTFLDPETKTESTELLGRDGSHWSAVFNSGSSVMDGVSLTDNGDGTFTAGPYSTQYGPLDLYAMGINSPEEVPPMFVLRNARYADNGQSVNPATDGPMGLVSDGRVLTGQRIDFTIDDVIASLGPRSPAWDDENEDFRVAFILVTKPGQTADSVSDRVTKLETGRLTWEAAHTEWTSKRSTMCTDITARCPLAAAEILDVTVLESPDNSDGDGVIEPGETVAVDATIANTGVEVANSVSAELTSTTMGVSLPEVATIEDIPVDGTTTHRFDMTIEGEACGEVVDLEVLAKIEHRRWKGRTSFRPGLLDAPAESFATDAGWLVNASRGDTAATGAWGYGVPEPTFFAGRTLQPEGGADGADDAAWVTGIDGEWDDGEVAGGATSLTSVDYNLSQLYAPILRYRVWYMALDRTPTSLSPSTEAHLIVQASGDGGTTWVDIDSVKGGPYRWELREAALLGKLENTENVQFRFVAADLDAADKRIVEIAIDDVAVVSLSDSCNPDSGGGGCGCQNVHAAPPAGTDAADVCRTVGRAAATSPQSHTARRLARGAVAPQGKLTGGCLVDSLRGYMLVALAPDAQAGTVIDHIGPVAARPAQMLDLLHQCVQRPVGVEAKRATETYIPAVAQQSHFGDVAFVEAVQRALLDHWKECATDEIPHEKLSRPLRSHLHQRALRRDPGTQRTCALRIALHG